MKWKNKTRDANGHTPAYISWNSMMTRVKSPHIVGEVCEDWKNFDNFVDWYNTVEKHVGWHLDKDLLIRDNKVYFPEACVYLPQEINKTIAGQNKRREGNLPTGITKYHNKYRAKCKNSLGGEWYQSFYFLEDAVSAYKIKKKDILVQLAEKYKDMLDKKAYHALLDYQF